MTRNEAESLRRDDRYWSAGVVYACRRDPRVIVRNRFVVGWTWNFGHPWALPALVAAVLFFLAPAHWLATRAPAETWQVGLMGVLCLAVLVAIAHRVASGPHPPSRR